MSQQEASKKQGDKVNFSKNPIAPSKQTKLPVKINNNTSAAHKKPQKSNYLTPSKHTINSKQSFESLENKIQQNSKHQNVDSTSSNKKQIQTVQVQE